MPEDIIVKPPKNYPLRGAIIFLVVHTIFIILLLVWSLHESIYSYSGSDFILYLIEIPGVVITKAIGQADNLNMIAPYVITFFINTIFYTLVGFGFGSLFHELGWVDESHNIFLTEEEIQEKERQEDGLS